MKSIPEKALRYLLLMTDETENIEEVEDSVEIILYSHI